MAVAEVVKTFGDPREIVRSRTLGAQSVRMLLKEELGLEGSFVYGPVGLIVFRPAIVSGTALAAGRGVAPATSACGSLNQQAVTLQALILTLSFAYASGSDFTLSHKQQSVGYRPTNWLR